MSKYGRENRRRAKRVNSAGGEEILPWIPPEGPANEITAVLQLGNYLIAQREVRLESTGMLVEFAIVVSDISGEANREVLCIDNCHRNNVHKHLNNHSEYALVKELLFEGDLDEAFRKAIEEATDLCLDKIGETDD